MRTMRTCIAVASLFVLLGSSGCGSSPSSLTPEQYGAKYQFSSTTISGWAQDTAAGPLWAGTDLVGAGGLDGGAGVYTDGPTGPNTRGFKMAMFQNLQGPGDNYCTFWAMDFGTAANAAAIFSYQKGQHNATVAIPPYDLSVAAGDIEQYADNVYATFGTSYFELQFSGFGDQTSTTGTGCTTLCTTAANFLAVLKAKTN
jgi:hypothetical protein